MCRWSVFSFGLRKKRRRGYHHDGLHHRIGDQGAIVPIDRNLCRRERRQSLPDLFPAESGKAHPWQIMQEMVDIPAAMPADADETDSKWHSRHTHSVGEKTVVAVERWVN